MDKVGLKFYLMMGLGVFVTLSCGSKHKLQELCRSSMSADISVSDNIQMEQLCNSSIDSLPKDRIAVVDRLGEVYVMDAVKDEELGEMVVSDRLNAVVVEAKFRNVAERNGYVDIAFDVRIPNEMQSSDWQVRMTPVLEYLGDKVVLDKIYVTGANYRQEQLRGYQLYERFLESIIPEDVDFVSNFTRKRLLELFIERNFKEIAKLKNDTSYVDNLIESELFGVTRGQVIEHYKKENLIRRNNRKIARKEKMYAKYVKVPIEELGVRLDSVIHNPDSSTIYHYTHTIKAKKGLRRVDLSLGGEIYRMERCIYTMPVAGPLTYYISSLTHFADKSPRYIKRIIDRNAVANMVSYIDFKQGEYTICDTLRNNVAEMARVKSTVMKIMEDSTYIIDSLTITASCSPEGAFRSNGILAQKRAESIRNYLKGYIMACADSLRSEYWNLQIGDAAVSYAPKQTFKFVENIGTRWIAEDWERLGEIIEKDTILREKAYLKECFEIEDPDEREKKMLKSQDCNYIKEILYPYLRCVKFDFYLHRKGMIKDTVHTTVVDSIYMQGVDALMEKDYKRAVTLLRPYRDMNSVVAFVCMDYNNSAMEILDELRESAPVNYMKSVVNARLGNENKAVEHFIRAVDMDPSMRHRGNLDPEISSLVKKYNVFERLGNN